MNVLLTCDDGYNSPGFAALKAVAKALKYKAWCLAPTENMSGIGSCRSLKRVFTDRVRGEKDSYYVEGTPVDCVTLAVSPSVRRALKLPKFDLVLSGINYGANVGRETIECSGTYAAARYAARCGVPAIAISQDIRDADPAKFHVRLAVKAVRDILSFNENWKQYMPLAMVSVANVNLPVKPLSKEWMHLWRKSHVSVTGGYNGDWRRLDDLRSGMKQFRWAQKWDKSDDRPSDVEALTVGCVTFTMDWMNTGGGE